MEAGGSISENYSSQGILDQDKSRTTAMLPKVKAQKTVSASPDAGFVVLSRM